MFTNYLKTTLRHILTSKVNFLFKLGGLTLALSSIFIIIVYVTYHLSFDTFHEGYKNIYRVNARWVENGSRASYAIIPPAVGPALKEYFPEVSTFARVGHSTHYLVKYGDKSIRIDGFLHVDTTVFDILSFKFLRGNRHSLYHPRSIVLTKSLAKEIFGNEDPLGKAITFVDQLNQTVHVTGIIEDPPPNTHLHIRALIADTPDDNWQIGIDGSGPLYVRLEEDVDVGNFVAKAIPFLRQRLTSGEDHLEKDYEIYLQPIRKIHLDPWIFADFTRKGNAAYVYVFTLLGIFLLAISAINYINLTIADFQKRAREIGVRKVLGASKKQIASQIVLETMFVCLLAAALSAGLAFIVFPDVTQRLDRDLTSDMFFNPDIIGSFAVIIGLLVFMSSIYPALHLATNKPLKDLKSLTGIRRHFTDRVLLCVQFTISVVCICATFVVSRQINFFQTRHPGFDRENSLVLYMPDQYPSEKIPVIKNELSKLQGVEAVSFSTFRIAAGGYYRDWYRVEINGEMKQMLLNEVFFDHDFFRTTGIEMLEGRNFDPDNPADAHAAFIVNETAVREFGWTSPLGKRISYGYVETDGEKWEGTVVGVVKDFNIYSLHRKIEPLVMRLPWSDWPGQCVHVRIDGPLNQTIARIKQKYEEIMPDFVMDYHLVAELYANQYENEQKAFASLQFATWIIVLISAIGIFSLSAYMSIRRMKEFGIRKVLGASVKQISLLHVGYFLKISLIANIIALPLAWWLTDLWLSQFAYRAEVGGLVYACVTLLSFVLILVSAGYASVRAGMMNPVDVIKGE